MYYIYHHIRPDTNVVFYVGRGKMYSRTAYPRRAHTDGGRNVVWKSIVERNNGQFIVDVVSWHETLEEVSQAEQDWIAKFGRLMLNNGTLCNLTAGGEGASELKHTEETKAKLRASHANNPSRHAHFKSKEFISSHVENVLKGNKFSLGVKPSSDIRSKMSNSHKNKHGRAVIHTKTGILFVSVEAAAKFAGIHKETLYKYLQGKRINYTDLRYA